MSLTTCAFLVSGDLLLCQTRSVPLSTTLDTGYNILAETEMKPQPSFRPWQPCKKFNFFLIPRVRWDLTQSHGILESAPFLAVVLICALLTKS